ncbi:MAG: TonB-dependent receptor [Candidatus Andeanibacterium colombiense]|uniref:TonB-dependent receptor n=1 Tax=Candidatus Andeanibacterium colombiense TaxID=3121345 RepID=A0AAJ5X7G9_9SPHN|nr:MAG: TonB-dependent receptor [Sphingomonadaceae bacterium]
MTKFDFSLRAILCGGVALGMLAVATPAIAADGAADAEASDAAALDDDSGAILVSASRSGDEQRVDQIGSSVTVIDAKEVSDRETRYVSDVLRDVPGVAVSRTIGGLTQVRIRGAEGNHVLVLIDGIKASDPYQGEFDFTTLTADDASRVEVLRGQQSALYGSDAIGGVINYITLSGREAPGIRLRAEGGSFGSYNGTARVAGASDNFDYAFSGNYVHTDGYAVAPGGSDNVGSTNWGASGKVNFTPTENFKLSGVLRYTSTKADSVDQDITADSPVLRGRQIVTAIDTPGSYFKNDALYGLVKAELTSFGGMMTTSLSGQFADTSRDAYTSFGYSYGDRGTRYLGSLVNTLRFGSDRVKHSVTLAADLESERFHSVASPDTSTHKLDRVGLVGEYNLLVDDRLSLGGSVRHDDNDFFKNVTTWHVDGSYLFPTGTRPHAAAGTGVKNPTSSELFGYYTGEYIGNPNLKPEESKGWEAGIDQSFANGKVTIGTTYFESRLHNEIYVDYLPPDYLGTSLNRTTVTKMHGVEVYGRADLGDVSIDAAYTWLKAPQGRNVLSDPEDPNSYDSEVVVTQAVRRPKDTASFNLTYAPSGLPISGTLTVRYNGDMKDVVYVAGYAGSLFADMPSYTLVNLSLRYKISDTLELYARAENLFDEDYQEVFTFKAPGRAIYGGVRARF